MQLTLVCISLANAQFYGSRVEEPQEYGPTAKPGDVPFARQVLGYDKYEKQPVQHNGGKYLYGNNWEQFDDPNQYPQLNFNYKRYQ